MFLSGKLDDIELERKRLEEIMNREKSLIEGLRIREFKSPSDFFEDHYVCYYYNCPRKADFPCLSVFLTPKNNFSENESFFQNWKSSDLCLLEYTLQHM